MLPSVLILTAPLCSRFYKYFKLLQYYSRVLTMLKHPNMFANSIPDAKVGLARNHDCEMRPPHSVCLNSTQPQRTPESSLGSWVPIPTY